MISRDSICINDLLEGPCELVEPEVGWRRNVLALLLWNLNAPASRNDIKALSEPLFSFLAPREPNQRVEKLALAFKLVEGLVDENVLLGLHGAEREEFGPNTGFCVQVLQVGEQGLVEHPGFPLQLLNFLFPFELFTFNLTLGGKLEVAS